MRRPLRISLLLLCSFIAAVVVSAQSTLPVGSFPPDALTRFCAGHGNSGCVVPFDGQYTLTLPTADWHLPVAMHLHFAPGSSLAVTGGVLHFDNASLEAPPDASLFPDPDRIRDLSAARPEWFAQAGERSGPVPASALAEAYEATVPWGTIYLQERQYISPFPRLPRLLVAFRLPQNSWWVRAGPCRMTPVRPRTCRTARLC